MSTTRVERQETEDGFNALITNQNIERGECILSLSGPSMPQPTRYTIQTGQSEHIHDSLGSFINHSCSPNASIRGTIIEANTRINKGTEVTINYNESEDIICHPFVCNCCGRIILGKKAGCRGNDLFDTGTHQFSIIRRQLDSQGVTFLPHFLSEPGHQMLLQERLRLTPYVRDKCFYLPPYNTPRISQTIGGVTISEQSPTILALYDHTRLKLQEMLGVSLYRCHSDQEFAVINYLHRAGAEHGWHMDDPSHVLVISLISPSSPSDGGHVEFVPDVVAQTGEAIELAVSSATKEGRVNRLFIRARDAYLIRGDKTLHRVTPLSNSERLIIAFSYDDTLGKQYDDSANLLYD
jgi:hypothetical protein